MTASSPLWPAQFHHFRLNSDRPEALVEFYTQGLGMTARESGDDLWLLSGAGRRFLIGRGPRETVPFAAYALDEPARLDALQQHLQAQAIEIEPNPSPLFGNAAFAVRDPDGLPLVFGVPADDPVAAGGLPGRLQHIVFATTEPERIRGFYADQLGYAVSDKVFDDGALSACFFRSDEEHHSYAAFRADAARFDHVAFETTGWMDIRDWADHFGSLRVPLWWGPGRHGPGNNLFFMVRDPDGNRVEISAELERMPQSMPHREWPHEEHTLNLWGQAWMRS